MMRNAVLALLVAANSSVAGTSVNVDYAGSLVTVMERSIGPRFMRSCSCTYYGEGRGSRALAHLIAGGLRHPDVFVSADPVLLEELLHPHTGTPLISWYAIFARSRLLLGYSQKSAFADTIQRAVRGEITLAALLKTPHLRIGRTDPQIDPKGARTVEDIAAMSRSMHDPQLLRAVQEAPPLPEEDLLVRLESGDLDVAFLYSVEARNRNIRTLELPRNANTGAQYAVAPLEQAASKAAATAFIRFILSGEGKTVLHNAGLDFFRPMIKGDSKEARSSLAL